MFGKKKFVEITFGADGSTMVEGHNFKGKACEEATKFLENLLGKVGKRVFKQERWNKDVQSVRRH